MESEWDWLNKRRMFRRKIKLRKKFRKEVNNYGIWKIWWTICTTRIKVKIK